MLPPCSSDRWRRTFAAFKRDVHLKVGSVHVCVCACVSAEPICELFYIDKFYIFAISVDSLITVVSGM